MQKAKKKDYAKNKKVFDVVMNHYRSLSGIGSISAINMASASKGSPNPARPTPLDFQCDVEKVIAKVIPLKHMARFIVAYIVIECDDSIQQERLADKLLGGMRHSFEQRCGEQFHKRKIYPVQGRGYFHTVRKGNPRGHHFKEEASPRLQEQ